MTKRILIVGGGTAGWLTTGYFARRLGSDLPGGADIRLVESSDIGVLGVGEGTFPTIRRTLSTIGIDEAELVRRCGATFKHGAKFVHRATAPGSPGPDYYFHAFQVAENPGGLELLPYWLLGAVGLHGWDQVSTPHTPQKAAVDAVRAPKLPIHPSFVGPLNYAFHFDAVTLAEMLRDQGIANGVNHLVDTVGEVLLTHSKFALMAPIARDWARFAFERPTLGFAKSDDASNQSGVLGRWRITAQYGLWSFGDSAMQAPPHPNKDRPVGGAALVQLGPDEFLLAGSDVRRFRACSAERGRERALPQRRGRDVRQPSMGDEASWERRSDRLRVQSDEAGASQSPARHVPVIGDRQIRRT